MEYRREIDGLRALAVIPVIFFHAGFDSFKGGFVGVDVFFVISGYLITSIILAEIRAGTFTLAGFYERRARRILPALFLVMLVCIPVAWMWLLPNEMRRFSASLVAVSTFSSNLLFYLTSGYFDAEGKPLLHTWSLAVEEQYYVLFPLFIMLAWRFGKRWIVGTLSAAAIVSLAAAQWYSIHKPQLAFLLLPTRFWELVIGVLIAFHLAETNRIHRSQAAPAIGIVLIVCAVVFFDRNTPFPSVYALLPTVGTALVILFAMPETVVGKFLGSKPCVGIGLISYSAYLWHQPLFSFAKHRSLEEPDKTLLFGLSAVALILAYFSWKYIEAPFRSRKRFTRNQVFLLGGLFSVAFSAFGLTGYLNGGFESRMPSNVLSVHILREHEKQIMAAGCKLHADGFHVQECVKGDKSVTPKYALIGDSHAQAITHELSVAFERSQLSFIPYVMLACPLYFDMPKSSGDDEDRECVAYQDEIQREVASNGVDTYIVVSRRDYAPAKLTAQKFAAFEAHVQSILRLLEQGKKVILVYPIPVHRLGVSDYMAKNRLFNGNEADVIAEDRQAFEDRTRPYRERYDAIGAHPNLTRVDAGEVFCNVVEKDKCVTQVDGVPLYFDESHLSNAGSRLLVEKIMKAVAR